MSDMQPVGYRVYLNGSLHGMAVWVKTPRAKIAHLCVMCAACEGRGWTPTDIGFDPFGRRGPDHLPCPECGGDRDGDYDHDPYDGFGYALACGRGRYEEWQTVDAWDAFRRCAKCEAFDPTSGPTRDSSDA